MSVTGGSRQYNYVFQTSISIFILYHHRRGKPRIVILGHYIKENLSYDLCPNREMVVSYATDLVIRVQRTKMVIDTVQAREACRVCPQLTHIRTEGLNRKYEWVRFINIANYWFLRLFEIQCGDMRDWSSKPFKKCSGNSRVGRGISLNEKVGESSLFFCCAN